MSSPIRPIPDPVILNPINLNLPTALSAANPTVTSANPQANVTVPNTSGSVTFQLIVTDNLGVASAPATFTVNIQGAPVAVLTGTPNPVGAGRTITLNGSGSKAADGGSIASYAYTLVTPANTSPSPILTNPINVTRG